VTVHLKVPGAMRTDQAHNIATRVEEIIKKEFEGDVTIHVELQKHGQGQNEND
jgi:divalent metal cation (Fe/Co/Zn/Cd) transporter